MGLNCDALGEVFYVYMLTNISKIDKINFDELPKKNSRIKIRKIKIIRFETKVLNFTF